VPSRRRARMIALLCTSEVPWLEPSRIRAGVKIIDNPDLALVDNDGGEAASDTRALRRN
jgi:hypothetical protein